MRWRCRRRRTETLAVVEGELRRELEQHGELAVREGVERERLVERVPRRYGRGERDGAE